MPPRALKVKHVIYILFGCLAIPVIIDQSGLMSHYHAEDYYSKFDYPLTGDIKKYMEQMKRGQRPDVDPINPHDYLMKFQAKGKCLVDDGDHEPHKRIRLVYVVKSAMTHFDRRAVIRRTWGYEKYEKVF